MCCGKTKGHDGRESNLNEREYDISNILLVYKGTYIVPVFMYVHIYVGK